MKNLSIFLLPLLFACSTSETKYELFVFDQFPQIVEAKARTIFIDSALNEIKDLCILSNAILTENSSRSDNLASIYDLESFSYKGGFLPKGRGPDEYLRVGYIRKINHNSVGFKSRTKYHKLKYDEGQYSIAPIADIRLKSEHFNFSHEFILDDECCIYGWDIEQTGSTELLRFNFKEKKYSGFGAEFPDIGVSIPESKKVSLFQKSIIVKPDLSRFVVLYTKFDRFRIYNHTGGIVKEVIHKSRAMPPKKYMTEKDYDNLPRSLLEKAYTYHLYGKSSNKYIYIPFYGEESKERARDLGVLASKVIRVFDWYGNPVAKIELDTPITSFDVDVNDEYIIAYSPVFGEGFYKFGLTLN